MDAYINDEISNIEYKSEISEENIKNILEKAYLCYDCNRCVNVCPLSHLNIFNPRMLVRDLIFSPVKDVLNYHNVWHCLTCGQCTIYCPMSQERFGVRIPELILELRKGLKNDKKQIERIIQCETHNNIIPIISEIMVKNPSNPNKLEFLRENSLKTSITGRIAYFVGCLPLMDEIFYDSHFNYIDIPITIISLLNECGISPVVLNEKCCGHDILWGMGDFKTFKNLAEYNTQIYRNAGVETIIVGCAEGYRIWKFDYPKIIPDFDFDVLHFSEFFLKEEIVKNVRFPHNTKIKVTYHDSCRIGRLGGKIYSAPRVLLNQIPGVELIEMENIKDDANCCGVSTFTNCNEFTHFLREKRINEAVNTGADYLIVPCPKCLTHFKCYLNELSLNGKGSELKNKIEVVDLASFIGKLLMIV